VSYHNAPVTGGNILLYKADAGSAGQKMSANAGPAATIAIHADGTFDVVQLAPGEYKVAIETDSLQPPPIKTVPGLKMTPEQEALMRQAQEKAKVAQQGENMVRYVQIPAKYRSPATSGLTWTIREGNNDSKDFDLTE